MKNIGFILMMGLCLLCACQDRDDFGTPDTADGKTEILLQQMDVPVVVTRAGEDRDTRIENVVIFVFDAYGNLLNTPVVQSAELTDNTAVGNVCYKIREYLPSNKSSLYAVCNYDQAADLIEKVKSKTDLENYVLEISSVEGAFKGAYVMEGATTNFSAPVTVQVTRVASRQEFTINFSPLTDGETFKLSSVAILNVPRKSNLLKDTYVYDENNILSWTGDAVYSTSVKEMAENYIDSTVVEVETVRENQYSLTLNLFENRRGGQTQETVDATLGIDDRDDKEKNKVRQLYKKDLAEGKLIKDVSYQYASCLVIEGVYQTASVAYHARYYVYLGHNNFGDFNVLRNYRYKYTITIQACDKMDTRVEADGIGNVSFFASEEPLDAHFEVRQGLLYAPADWEIYVKEPDKTPWLEISTSASYVPQQLGGTGSGCTGSGCAQYRLKGSMGSHYIYIHADEYVPLITDPAQNTPYNERTGIICYKRADSDEVQEFTVTQKPAQLVVVEAWDVNLAKKVTHKFFVEAVPDKDYLRWGFEHHWNLTMDNLITTGQYDGLSTSRKEYVTALWGDKRSDTYKDVEQAPLALDGAQPAAYRTVNSPLTNVPVDIALGNALFKNRDRNGNGRIDYNEILWYLPGVIQLEGIQEAIGKTVTLDLQGETFWSATPSVSDKGGITPGRAYYVKMSNGKRGIGLRDQQFRVLCCRDAEGWTGPEDGNGSGNVGTDDSWTDNEQNMPK